jgi:putative CocE/NonD family hydrolase
MKYVEKLPREILVEDTWIPLPDGVRLHARVWRPRDSGDNPVPGLLEYLPYRLDDWTAPRDNERHPYYAGHGYASVRVDIRGTGSSGGIFVDEYSEQEQADGLEVIAWIAAQPWCTGTLGMFGISWGGFNSLQLAGRAPEALKAIVTVCSTDDRYDNDVHYMGGALLGIDMASWGGTMFAFNARPPRPEVVGDGWVQQWRDRLERTRPMTRQWLQHQERDDYWRHGSVCEDYSSLTAAVLAVGGWHDPYRDAVLRLVENLDAPVRGIIGPWAHQYPDRGYAPGPGINFLRETLAWWDHWLKGAENGVEQGPKLIAFLPDGDAPATHYARREGRWLGIDEWPSARITAQGHTLSEGTCTTPVRDGLVLVRSPQHTGADAGRYFPFGNATDLPPDQRAEDGLSVCINFAQLSEPLGILGNPRVRLRLRSDEKEANVIARLCDVAPDGSSTLVTRGVLNLNKRMGREKAVPMPTGEFVDVEFEMVGIGYVFAPGHTVRLALSSNYWPWIWPPAIEPTLEVDLAASGLELPALAGDFNDLATTSGLVDGVGFGEPEQSARLPVEYLKNDGREIDERFVAGSQRSVHHDVETGEWVLDVDPGYGGSRRYPDGLVFTEYSRETYSIRNGDPLSGQARSAWSIALSNDGWSARLETSSVLACDATSFLLANTVSAWATVGEGEEQLVAEQEWNETIPRTST